MKPTGSKMDFGWIQYVEKLLPDGLFLFLMIFCSRPLMDWQLQHLSLSCTLLMVLNIAAVSLGCYRFFSGYADSEGLMQYAATLRVSERTILGLSVFISCFAFLWWLVPFAAAKTLGVKETGFILGMTVYFICFIGIVAGSISNRKALEMQERPSIKMANALAGSLFFYFSTCFLLTTLPWWHPGFIAAKPAAVLCMIVFYLPLRIFLLLKPPFHRFELPLFLLGFAYLMARLFF